MASSKGSPSGSWNRDDDWAADLRLRVGEKLSDGKRGVK